ncbi:MAG: hypothetical protein RIQ52_423 [Pseudomonadota bacterium]|jgi:ribonuclease-3
MTGMDAFVKLLGLRFQRPELLQEAMTHRSAGAPHNERLEFLGDAILGYVIAEWLFEHFPRVDEGVLSRLRAGLVNQTVLAEMARSLKVGDYLVLGPGELKSGGFRRDSILSDAYEAIMGAIYLDQGHDRCRQWILQQFAGRLASLSIDDWRKDPKTQLQELLQGRGHELPEYVLLSTEGHAHDQSFYVECRVNMPIEHCRGRGTSRKRAEQQAAEAMLERVQELFRKKT